MKKIFGEDKKEAPLQASDNKIIFSYSSNFIKHWNNAVIVLAIYNSVTIPLDIFYQENGPTFLGGEFIAVLDAFVDLIFLIDVIITFRTTYLDVNIGEEVIDTHKIAKHYLKGSFTIDFASSVPFEAFVPASQTSVKSFLTLFGLLKLLRIQRLSAAVTGSNLPKGTKVQLKILMIGF